MRPRARNSPPGISTMRSFLTPRPGSTVRGGSQSHDPSVSIARGGVLKDLGCYPIDLILWYFGEFNTDSATSESLTGPRAVDSVRFNVLGNGSIPPGEVFVSWCVEGYRMPELEFSIIGSKGTLLVNDDYVRLDVGGEVSTFYQA